MLLGAYVVQTRGTLAWEPVVASIPAVLLIALILVSVNDSPDRRGDAFAGKRTLPVRFLAAEPVDRRLQRGSGRCVCRAFVIGVALGVLPIPTLLMLLTILLARRVSSGLAPNYDNPYGLMAVMGVNVKVHLVAGLPLFARPMRSCACRRGRRSGGRPRSWLISRASAHLRSCIRYFRPQRRPSASRTPLAGSAAVPHGRACRRGRRGPKRHVLWSRSRVGRHPRRSR